MAVVSICCSDAYLQFAGGRRLPATPPGAGAVVHQGHQERRAVGRRCGRGIHRPLSTSWSLDMTYYVLRLRSINGEPLTEHSIATWADEAEHGHDVDRLRRRGRKAAVDGPVQVIPVRLDKALLAALGERAERDHVSRSAAIREAIPAYVG